MKLRKIVVAGAGLAAAFLLGVFVATRGRAPKEAQPPAAASSDKGGWDTNVVAIVNGHALSRTEFAQRGATMLRDAQRTEHIAFTKEKEPAAIAYYSKLALRTWIAKEVMLYGAISAGVKPTRHDEQQAFDQIKRALATRKTTPEQFFREGPLDEAVKKRDFFDAVMVSRFVQEHVQAKVAVDDKAVDARVAELKDLNVKTTKPGQKPRFHTDRKSVREMLVAERQAIAYRRAFRELFPKAGVKCPEFPEFEKAEGVEPKVESK